MTQSDLQERLRPSLVIDNRYRLIRQLGSGSMGSIWVAHHLALGVDVAVKFIDPSLATKEEFQSRFAQEARAAARIQNQHVVGIHDYNTDQWGRPYIVMEMLKGEDLAQHVARYGPVSLEGSVQLLSQACKGLEKAHAAGIVHRDVKPENVFLSFDDNDVIVKILDFGVAKAKLGVNNRSTHQTAAGVLVGTPLYMSPEQATGKNAVDARSDLYSMALVLYYALTETYPLVAANLGELVHAIATKEIPPPSKFRSEIPVRIDEWFRTALSKDPATRFQTARAMAESYAKVFGDGDATYAEWALSTQNVLKYKKLHKGLGSQQQAPIVKLPRLAIHESVDVDDEEDDKTELTIETMPEPSSKKFDDNDATSVMSKADIADLIKGTGNKEKNRPTLPKVAAPPAARVSKIDLSSLEEPPDSEDVPTNLYQQPITAADLAAGLQDLGEVKGSAGEGKPSEDSETSGENASALLLSPYRPEGESGENPKARTTPKRPKKKSSRPLYTVLFLLALAAFIFSAYFLYQVVSNDLKKSNSKPTPALHS
jgi:serine/threonine protein kinase